MISIVKTTACLICLASVAAYAQSGSQSSSDLYPHSETDPSIITTANAPVRNSDSYRFPDHKQQFRNYLYSTFGPPGLISSAIGAGIDQGKPAPPEWDSGAQGYGERYGSRFTMNLTAKTSEYSLGALMHEDVAYHRCDCTGFFPRTAHAFASVLTAKTRSGRTVFSVPSLVSPYAGSFMAVNAWYPSRYEPADALRIGNMSFVFKAGGNLIGEFIAPRR